MDLRRRATFRLMQLVLSNISWRWNEWRQRKADRRERTVIDLMNNSDWFKACGP